MINVIMISFLEKKIYIFGRDQFLIDLNQKLSAINFLYWL